MSSTNPLLLALNQVVDFQALKAEHIGEATTQSIEKAKAELAKIYAISAQERTFENTLLASDKIESNFSKVFGYIYLLANSSDQEDIYQECHQNIEVLQQFGNELSLDENLYRSVKEYSQTAEAKSLTGYQKKLAEENLREFERNGFALPIEKREELKKLKNELSSLSTLFQKNIAQFEDHLMVNEKGIQGLADDYKKARLQDDGDYKINLDYPSYVPFMQYSESQEARKELAFKFSNRAKEQNLDLLQKVLKLRREMAVLLGYPTYAAYRMENKMAKTPKTVWDFETKLQEKVHLKAQQDYEELLALKNEKQKDNSAQNNKIFSWESSYYKTLLLKEKYAVDQQKIKEYFEVGQVLKGIFKITKILFNVEMQEVKNASVWHDDVILLEVRENNAVIGRCYLDLYPRKNKYGHAACFPIVMGRNEQDTYQIPTVALLCNFPKPSEEQASLLQHSQVTTFFHEFGHALHNLLTQSPVAAYAGTNVVHDFVEVPSQLFENWCWNYESLQLFAKHYKTGETLPSSLFDKLLAAKNVGSGLHILQQILYGTYDLTLHDSSKKLDTTQTFKELQERITLFPFFEGTHFEAAFGHLMGYGASYYGYLWSLVYAEDMFSAFEEQGVLNSKVGLAYRKEVLSKGGSLNEMEQIKAFLGREPKQDAFLKSIGLK